MTTGANPRYANGHRRRRLRRRVLAHYTVCHLCGRLVDKTLPPTHPGAPEVDEIIPISRGGSPYEWCNLALSHRLCNQKRGNKPLGESKQKQPASQPMTSREW